MFANGKKLLTYIVMLMSTGEVHTTSSIILRMVNSRSCDTLRKPSPYKISKLAKKKKP